MLHRSLLVLITLLFWFGDVTIAENRCFCHVSAKFALLFVGIAGMFNFFTLL